MLSAKEDWFYSFKQIIPKSLAKLYLANIKKVCNPYRVYNHKYKCIFVHIPKTAGTSLGKTIFEDRDPSVSHSDAFYYQVFDTKLFKEYFKFTFVRNPWDRLVSSYNYFKKRDIQDEHKKIVESFDNFDGFVSALEDIQLAKKIFKLSHFRPQYQFVCDLRHNLLVDYIGYFETLEQDFEQIVIKLNRPELKLPHLNSSKEGLDYRDFYTEKTQKILAALYSEDIELFGYNFDGINKKVIV
ncbi:sulfotransferase family 2 domain-containing protein [Gloeocapsa sp. PCC 73106]|uniref:sulfotransferase family 2 domain-containing protein n=1 Tax=Gloeocapsa sp. PCC 73106 TaxID=102232 RepID=UPI0002ABE0DD|nr:sulfotransferase family 2 domain-containing protein [Gloeocapsa sp. PCC 73106]ELR97924.1 Sulfotransferase family [Gloeocapsa sp. PCC 73106]